MIIGLALAGAAGPQQQAPHSATQAGMREAADVHLKAAETDMASLLSNLSAKAQGKAESIDALDKAQAAWVKYRDAQLKAEWPMPEGGQYGTVYPMCLVNERTRLTKARIAELRSMLRASEGDVCSSHWPE
jgi:uncharacterized protein YecT (DUF1311 family)